jgi:uncharacterized protein YcbX
MIKIASLHIYPIKSLGGISLQETRVTSRGLAYDRRWVLVDENNRFVSQREYANMALLQPSMDKSLMKITDRSGIQESLSFDLAEPKTEPEMVTVWDDTMPAKPVSTSADEWFSRFMQMPVRLMYMHEDSFRQADQRYAITENDKVSFADGYPILIISEASMAQLNAKLDKALQVGRFRANIIVSGTDAHEEDSWREIQTAQQTLYGVKPCARCVMTTIDPQTAQSGTEPLKTLSTYRFIDNKILFGENFIPKEDGVLQVGDEIKVLSKKETLL